MSDPIFSRGFPTAEAAVAALRELATREGGSFHVLSEEDRHYAVGGVSKFGSIVTSFDRYEYTVRERDGEWWILPGLLWDEGGA